MEIKIRRVVHALERGRERKRLVHFIIHFAFIIHYDIGNYYLYCRKSFGISKGKI